MSMILFQDSHLLVLWQLRLQAATLLGCSTLRCRGRDVEPDRQGQRWCFGLCSVCRSQRSTFFAGPVMGKIGRTQGLSITSDHCQALFLLPSQKLKRSCALMVEWMVNHHKLGRFHIISLNQIEWQKIFSHWFCKPKQTIYLTQYVNFSDFFGTRRKKWATPGLCGGTQVATPLVRL